MQGILFDNHIVELDTRSYAVGGAWSGGEGKVFTKDGKQIFFTERIVNGRHHYRKGIPLAYDMNTIKFFYAKTLEVESPVVFDIGANTGSFCLLGTVNPKIMCYAFEPHPFIYEILNSNIKLNSLEDKVKTFQIALAHKTGSTSLKYQKEHSASACISTNPRFDDCIEINVPLSTVDEIVTKEKIEKVDLIKIDTEGCELLVLAGAEKTIEKHHPGLLVECNECTKQFGYEPYEIAKLLELWGYSYVQVSADDLYFYHSSF